MTLPYGGGSGTVGRLAVSRRCFFAERKNRSPTSWAITPPTLRATPLMNEGGKFAARWAATARACPRPTDGTVRSGYVPCVL